MDYERYDVYISCEDWVKSYGLEYTRGVIRGIMIGCGEDVIFTQLDRHDDAGMVMYVPVYCTEDTVKRFIKMVKKYFPEDVRCNCIE